MALLKNKTKDIVLASDLKVAKSIWARTKGLLGHKSLPKEEALWITPCSSIHTCFMKFPIDVAFVDRNLKVTRISTSVKPWRFVFSTFKSESVFEFSSGVLKPDRIEVGDELYVDH